MAISKNPPSDKNQNGKPKTEELSAKEIRRSTRKKTPGHQGKKNKKTDANRKKGPFKAKDLQLGIQQGKRKIPSSVLGGRRKRGSVWNKREKH